MRKYSESASKTVAKAMHDRKDGTLKSGRSGKAVKSRKQAIAIGLSEARKAGKKVPQKKMAHSAFAPFWSASLTRYATQAVVSVGLFRHGGTHPPYGVAHIVGY